MATYTLTSADHGAYAKTLVANTVDTVTFGKDVSRVEVISDGTAAVYVTVDGTTPVVAAGVTFELPAGGGAAVREIVVPTSGNTVVKLISTGTPKYSVSEVSS